jgi:hypothetical protein
MPIPRDEPRTRVITVPNPAAGAEFTITPDDGGLWLVLGIVAQLVTSGVAGTRAVALRVDDQSATYMIAPAGTTQITGLTRLYSAFPGVGAAAANGSIIGIPWPSHGLILRGGHRIRSVTEVIDVGDQWSAIAAQVVSYPRRGPGHPSPATSFYEESEGN